MAYLHNNEEIAKLIDEVDTNLKGVDLSVVSFAYIDNLHQRIFGDKICVTCPMAKDSARQKIFKWSRENQKKLHGYT